MKNFPALKCYTSENQYNALKVIRDTKSITPVLTDGRSSKTLGSLVRSAWIQEREYADNKVTRMGWFLTKEGENAIQIYEADQEVKRLIKEDQTKKLEHFKKRYSEYHALVTRLNSIKKEKERLEKDVWLLDCELAPLISHLLHWEKQQLCRRLTEELDKQTTKKESDE
jgi:DNA-binding HxlR family transcriptional regulator